MRTNTTCGLGSKDCRRPDLWNKGGRSHRGHRDHREGPFTRRHRKGFKLEAGVRRAEPVRPLDLQRAHTKRVSRRKSCGLDAACGIPGLPDQTP